MLYHLPDEQVVSRAFSAIRLRNERARMCGGDAVAEWRAAGLQRNGR
jgi:hypothetical protein